MAGWRPLDGEDFPTLGYMVADWLTEFLYSPDSNGEAPFVPTVEQLEFLVRLYQIDPKTLTRVKHRAVLSRPRGWGKSPFLAALAVAEAWGPIRCDGFDAAGQPVGVPIGHYMKPNVAIAATTAEQTANTFEPLTEMLAGSPAEYEYGLEIQADRVVSSRGMIYTITASANSIKGKRSNAAIMDQTELWRDSNGGTKLAQVLRNNATKLDGVTIETPNAYTIGENSVAELSAQHAENCKAGRVKGDAARAFLWDHRSAPLDTDMGDLKSLVNGIRVAYGDSSDHPDGCLIHEPPCPPGWAPVHRIAADFWDTSNDPDVMRADFLNIIGAASDAWITAPELRLIENADIEVPASEPVCIGFDGSEGRARGIADSTVLIGYAVKQRHLFRIGVWEQPDGPKGEGWRPPELEILQTVADTFEKYNVVGFMADPSAGWATHVKEWEAKYGRRLKVKATSDTEPVRWNQRNVTATAEAFEQLRADIRAERVTYDGSPELTRHFLNARIDPRRGGYVLKKPDDNHDYGKIDAAYGAMLAHRAGINAIGKGVTDSRARMKAPRRLY